MEKIVIIGGVAAGPKAAFKARRLLPDAKIIVFTEDTHVSYSACGLPFFVEGNFKDFNMLIARTPEDYAKQNIDLKMLHRCIKILPDEKKVLIKNLTSGEEFYETYDKLMLATGAKPIIPNIKNIGLKNVYVLRTIEDGLAIREKIANASHATIIGGGYIGIELLEAFVKQKLSVSLVEFAPRIMPIFDEEFSELIKQHILSKDGDKVEIITSDAVVEILGEDSVVGVRTKNGREIKTDLVIVSVGVRPCVDIAQEAGIELGPTGSIKVNNKMQTNFPDIFAGGDCCEKIHLVSKTPVWVPLGSTANKEGRSAAINMCDGNDSFEGILGSAVTRYFGFTMSLTGLTEKQANALGFDTVSTVVTKKDKVGYMPEAKNITIKLVADKKSRKLLGAQAIGCGDADKRVNSITTGLLCGITADDLFDNDLTYAPPYSPSIDPLLNAAQNLIEKLDN